MEQLTKSKERIKKYGEVFTPLWVVNDMLDNLPTECFSPEKTFLEPACGEGVFVIEILRRKFNNCKKRKDYTTALESVYGLEIQADNVEICIENVINLCKEYFKHTKKEIEIINNHIIQADSLKVMKMMIDENLEDEVTRNKILQKSNQAIKEFAERLKDRLKINIFDNVNSEGFVYESDIDNLVKEMTEESENDRA